MSYAPFPLVWGFFGPISPEEFPSFATVQTDFGTYPSASASADILTLISADNTKYYFTGTALTDTVTLTINGLMPSGGAIGQVLLKQSLTNYDSSWQTLTTGNIFDLNFSSPQNGDKIVYDFGDSEWQNIPGERNYTVTLTATDITNKYITLNFSPKVSQSVSFIPQGGLPQIYGIDFQVISGNLLSWNGLGLEGFLEAGDVVVVNY